MSAVLKPGGFDYASLSAELAESLRQRAAKIRQQMRATIPIILEIGRELVAAKEKLDHGRFIKWVEAEVGITRRTAQRYMAAAKFSVGKSDTVSLLSVGSLYQLSAKATPTKVVDEVVTKTRSGLVTEAEIETLLSHSRAKQREDARQKREETEKAEKERRVRIARKGALRDAEEREKAREAAEAWVAQQQKQNEKPPDHLAVLQRAWDAAPDEIKKQFAIANGVQLRSFLGMTSPIPGTKAPLTDHAIAAKVERALARSSQTTTPAPKAAPIDLEIPGFLRRQ
jgi:hypothetical protein